jgi:glutamine amidotransferase
MITIINYGLGNLGSVQKAIKRIGFESVVTDDIKLLIEATALILPGVGNFKLGVDKLKKLGFIDVLNEVVLVKQIPILGICLGMQLMTSHSEEGDCEGLNWVPGLTKKFSHSEKIKVPHMGWNNLDIRMDNKILNDITANDFFYFVHSYFVTEIEEKYVLSVTNYGQEFISAFAKDNIFGCQFHPEKSHDVGLKLLQNFCSLATNKIVN